MRKNFAIFILLFTLCLIVGFVGVLVFNPKTSTLPAPNFNHPTSSCDAAIQNILLIHVNNLSSPKPTLISVWAIMIKKTDQLHFFFSMLSPLNTNQTIEDSLQKSFSINRELELSPDFMEALAKLPNNEWQGYILVDNLTVKNFLEDMGIQAQPLNLSTAQSPEQVQSLTQIQSDIFRNICNRPEKLFDLVKQKSAPFISDPTALSLMRNIQAYTGTQSWICEIP